MKYNTSTSNKINYKYENKNVEKPGDVYITDSCPNNLPDDINIIYKANDYKFDVDKSDYDKYKIYIDKTKLDKQHNVDISNINKPYYPTGWVCPKCGRVYGPNVSQCSACNAEIMPDKTKITF